jgi:drug/metabolite transporter (DMT)-like permease
MGAAAALASSALWALSSVLLASQSGRVKPLMMSAIRSLTASVFLVVLLFISDGWAQFAEASAITIISMMGSGIMGQAVGDTIYINALGILGVNRSFPITNSAYPFLTFLLAVLLLGEPVTWTLPIGGALIVAGIIWIVLEQHRAEESPAVRADVLRGVILAVAAALAWATATIWLRGQQGNLDAIGAACLRIPAASLAVWFTIAVTRNRFGQTPVLKVTPLGVGIIALAGLVGTGLGSVLFVYAVENLGAAKTAFLTTSAPLFALPMGFLFLSEQLTPRILLGTLVTIAGIWLVLL